MFRFCFRSLLSARSSTFFIVSVLALIIGINAATFTLVEHLLISPIPYSHAERLVSLAETEQSTNAAPVTEHDFQRWLLRAKSFSGMAAYDLKTATLSSGSSPLTVTILRCTPGLADVLDEKPLTGHWFSEDTQTAFTAILSYDFWQSHFGGKQDVVGSVIHLDHHVYTISGVMPRKFSFPSRAVSLWIPLTFNENLTLRDGHYLRVIARLNNGISIEAASQEMQNIAGQLSAETPSSNTKVSARVHSFRDEMVGGRTRPLLMLQLSVMLVLLAGCANVITLFISRSMSRRRDVAMQLALGATRASIFGQCLLEALMLSLAGTIAGSWLSSITLHALNPIIASYTAQSTELSMDGNILLFLMLVCGLVTLVCALVPVLYIRNMKISETLKESNFGAAGTIRRRRWFQGIVIAEIAACSLLLICTAVTIKSFLNLVHINCGINPQGVMVTKLALPEGKYKIAQHLMGNYEKMLETLHRELPTATVAFTTDLPVDGTGANGGFSVDGGLPGTANNVPACEYISVSPEFFTAFQIPLIAGRTFTADDLRQNYKVVIIDEQMARIISPGSNPIGKRLSLDLNDPPEWREIVGVVGGVKYFGVKGPAQPAAYIPFTQIDGPYAAMLLRSGRFAIRSSSPNESRVTGALRSALHQVDPDQPLGRVESMDDIISASAENTYAYAVLLSIFGLAALIIAAQGMFAVTSYSVTSRLRDFALRLALGASRGMLGRMLLREAFLLTICGFFIGLFGAMAVTHMLADVVYGVRAAETILLLFVSGIFAMITLIATLVPARRILSINPHILLK